MTKDDIIRMAREAGLPMAWISGSGVLNWTDLKAFADLIAAHKAEVITAEAYRCGVEAGTVAEREACAKLCENHVAYPSRLYFAAAIRARNQA